MRPVVIKRGKCVITLYDVDNLTRLPLASIRKMWAIMLDAAWENETAIGVIRAWLPEATAAAEDRIQTLEAELETARRNAEAMRQAVAVMGTALMERVTIAERELARAKKKKLAADKPARYQTLYDAAMLPKTEHALAIKEVARLDRTLKTAKADHAKAEKLQAIFTNMAAKAGL